MQTDIKRKVQLLSVSSLSPNIRHMNRGEIIYPPISQCIAYGLDKRPLAQWFWFGGLYRSGSAASLRARPSHRQGAV
eukprot:SAG25_NODE_559_length_6924_cov_15.045421_10_plen_77_part_00